VYILIKKQVTSPMFMFFWLFSFACPPPSLFLWRTRYSLQYQTKPSLLDSNHVHRHSSDLCTWPAPPPLAPCYKCRRLSSQRCLPATFSNQAQEIDARILSDKATPCAAGRRRRAPRPSPPSSPPPKSTLDFTRRTDSGRTVNR
jgi:hypothetical protein